MAKAIYKIKVSLNLEYEVTVPSGPEKKMLIAALVEGSTRLVRLCAFGFTPLRAPEVRTAHMTLQKKGNKTRFKVPIKLPIKKKVKT